MRTPRQDGNTNGGQEGAPKHGTYSSVWSARAALSWRRPGWRRFASDSMLAIAGITLVTLIIAAANLYPRLPSSVLSYLLVIVVLASLLGNYAAILASLLASFAFDFFLASSPEPYTFAELDDVLDPAIFLTTAIVTGQLTALLRKHTEQARRKERETRLLAEQAQELAALQERERIARELHDSVSQALYGISLGAQTARDALNRDPADVAVPLDYVIALAEAGMADMRALIFELRPESLASEGLTAALTKQVAVLRTHYKLEVDAQLGEEPNISLECKQVLYRIAQETLHNIVKHACAHTVLLRLSMREDALLLEVCDDGKGFDPTEPFPGHLGIRSIQERTASLDGVCSIESAPAQGTCLRVHIPAHRAAGLGGKHI